MKLDSLMGPSLRLVKDYGYGRNGKCRTKFCTNETCGANSGCCAFVLTNRMDEEVIEFERELPTCKSYCNRSHKRCEKLKRETRSCFMRNSNDKGSIFFWNPFEGRKGNRSYRSQMKRFPCCTQLKVLDVVFLLFVCLLGLIQMSKECPASCECLWKSGKESVLCSSMSMVPEGLDQGTQVLNMTASAIQRLPSSVFLSLGLLNLQRIYLTNCQLISLDKDAFKKLTNLVELELSNNQLNFVPSHSFSPILELRELKLNFNPISRIANNAFLALPRLIRLEMTSCRIGTIEPNAFRGLTALEWLRLDGNRLLAVQASSFLPLKSLHGLELAGNPWNCSCDLQPLRDWMLRNNVPFGVPPICSLPRRLSGRLWDELQLEDFACLPKLQPFVESHKVVNIQDVVEGQNATLVCQLEATPDTQVRWFMGTRPVTAMNGTSGTRMFSLMESFVWDADSKGDENGSRMKKYEESIGNEKVKDISRRDRSVGLKISQLTISHATPKDSGIYTCRAISRAGAVSANFSLVIVQNKTEHFTGPLLLFGALITILLTLIVCLVLVCVIFGGGWGKYNVSSTEELTEEKIEMNALGANGTDQNGGGTVPLMNDEHSSSQEFELHRPNATSSTLGGTMSRTSQALPSNCIRAKGKSSNHSTKGTGGDHSRESYKILPTNDPDDDNEAFRGSTSIPRLPTVSEGQRDKEEKQFSSQNLNTKCTTKSPEGVKDKTSNSESTFTLMTSSASSSGPNDAHSSNSNASKTLKRNEENGGKSIAGNSSPVKSPAFPDLVGRADGGTKTPVSDFSLLNAYQAASRYYFDGAHRRINSDGNSSLYLQSLPNSAEKICSSGYSMLSTSSTASSTSTHQSYLSNHSDIFWGIGKKGVGMTTNTLGSSVRGSRRLGEFGSGNKPYSHYRHQRLSMPTSPVHDYHNDIGAYGSQVGNHRALSSSGTHIYSSDGESNASNIYDYHAAQLAAFLEEYRALQSELMKMKASLSEVNGIENFTKSTNVLVTSSPEKLNNTTTTWSKTVNSNPNDKFDKDTKSPIGNPSVSSENECKKFLSPVKGDLSNQTCGASTFEQNSSNDVQTHEDLSSKSGKGFCGATTVPLCGNISPKDSQTGSYQSAGDSLLSQDLYNVVIRKPPRARYLNDFTKNYTQSPPGPKTFGSNVSTVPQQQQQHHQQQQQQLKSILKNPGCLRNNNVAQSNVSHSQHNFSNNNFSMS